MVEKKKSTPTDGNTGGSTEERQPDKIALAIEDWALGQSLRDEGAIQGETGIALPEDALGERLKVKRMEMKLTHDGLSDLTRVADVAGRGISRTTIRGYELGTYKPGAREIRILSKALKVSPTWLILGSDASAGATSQAGRPQEDRPRWSERVLLAISYGGLAAEEQRIVRELVESMYRARVGELKFLPMKAFIEDFADMLQDAVRDLAEQGKAFDFEALKAVLADTAIEMGKRHGSAEQGLMEATGGLLPALLEAILADKEAKQGNSG